MLIQVEQRNDVWVVRMSGRFVAGVDPEYLSAKADEIKRLNRGKVLADLSEVPVIGSSGIGFLASIYSSVARNSGGRFVLTGLQPRVREVLDLTRLNTVIPVTEDFESGMAALQGKPATQCLGAVRARAWTFLSGS